MEDEIRKGIRGFAVTVKTMGRVYAACFDFVANMAIKNEDEITALVMKNVNPIKMLEAEVKGLIQQMKEQTK